MINEIEWLDKIKKNFSDEQFNIDENNYRVQEYNQNMEGSNFYSGTISFSDTGSMARSFREAYEVVDVQAMVNAPNPFLESAQVHQSQQQGVAYPVPTTIAGRVEQAVDMVQAGLITERQGADMLITGNDIVTETASRYAIHGDGEIMGDRVRSLNGELVHVYDRYTGNMQVIHSLSWVRIQTE